MSKLNLPATPELEPNENTEAPNRLLEFLKAQREKSRSYQNQFKGHKPSIHAHSKLKERVRRRA